MSVGPLTTAAMKCFLIFVFTAIASAGAKSTSNNDKDHSSNSGSDLKNEDSVSRLQNLIQTDAANIASLSDNDIKDYFDSSNRSVPRVSDLVARVKQGDKIPVALWRGIVRATAIKRPWRRAKIIESNPAAAAAARQGLNRKASDQTAAQQDDSEGKADELLLADQARESEPEAVPGEPGTGGSEPQTGRKHNGKITISIDAVRNPRRSRSRQMRPWLYGPLNDQQDNAAFYPSAAATQGQIYHARGRSRSTSPSAEALALLTQQLSRMEVEMTRMKEAVLLQGAVHIKTSERMEAMLLAQGRLSVKNEILSRKLLKRLKRCCSCSSAGGATTSSKGREARTSLTRSRSSRRRNSKGAKAVQPRTTTQDRIRGRITNAPATVSPKRGTTSAPSVAPPPPTTPDTAGTTSGIRSDYAAAAQTWDNTNPGSHRNRNSDKSDTANGINGAQEPQETHRGIDNSEGGRTLNVSNTHSSIVRTITNENRRNNRRGNEKTNADSSSSPDTDIEMSDSERKETRETGRGNNFIKSTDNISLTADGGSDFKHDGRANADRTVDGQEDAPDTHVPDEKDKVQNLILSITEENTKQTRLSPTAKTITENDNTLQNDQHRLELTTVSAVRTNNEAETISTTSEPSTIGIVDRTLSSLQRSPGDEAQQTSSPEGRRIDETQQTTSPEEGRQNDETLQTASPGERRQNDETQQAASSEERRQNDKALQTATPEGRRQNEQVQQTASPEERRQNDKAQQIASSSGRQNDKTQLTPSPEERRQNDQRLHGDLENGNNEALTEPAENPGHVTDKSVNRNSEDNRSPLTSPQHVPLKLEAVAATTSSLTASASKDDKDVYAHIANVNKNTAKQLVAGTLTSVPDSMSDRVNTVSDSINNNDKSKGQNSNDNNVVDEDSHSQDGEIRSNVPRETTSTMPAEKLQSSEDDSELIFANVSKSSVQNSAQDSPADLADTPNVNKHGVKENTPSDNDINNDNRNQHYNERIDDNSAVFETTSTANVAKTDTVDNNKDDAVDADNVNNDGAKDSLTRSDSVQVSDGMPETITSIADENNNMHKNSSPEDDVLNSSDMSENSTPARIAQPPVTMSATSPAQGNILSESPTSPRKLSSTSRTSLSSVTAAAAAAAAAAATSTASTQSSTTILRTTPAQRTTTPTTSSTTTTPTTTSSTTTPPTTATSTTTTPTTSTTTPPPTTTSSITTPPTTMSTTTTPSTTTTAATTTTIREVNRNLTVDLSTGEIENDDLPGVSWVVHPGPTSTSRNNRPSKVWARAAPPTLRWRRSSTTQLDRLCNLQGVLKFTFTPPPPRSRPHRHSRGRHHRRRHHGGGGGDESGGASQGGRRRLLLEMEFGRPWRWVFNLGDSIANNGFSGDGTVQENDAEVQGYGTTFAAYGSDKHPNVRQKQLRMFNGFIFERLTLVVSDQNLTWDNHRGNADSLEHPSLFALSGQTDNQGDVNYDVFLGLNRVIDGKYRYGRGLCRLSARWLDN